MDHKTHSMPSTRLPANASKMSISRTLPCSFFSKSFVAILLLTSAIAVWKHVISAGSHHCETSMSKTYQIVADSNNRFFHHIAQFKVSHSAPGLELYVYTAFLDKRYNQTVLRIFGMEQKGGLQLEFKCKFVNEENHATTETLAKRYWIDASWPEWSPYMAVEYNCPSPDNYNYPQIDFFTNDGKYKLKLPLEQPNRFQASNRQDLAICIKPITGYQGTYRLVEWIETLKAAGYAHIIIYQSDITGPGRHILEYYQEKGVVSVINFPYLLSVIQSVENPQRTSQERYALYQQIYLIAMHDCLYRFSTLYRYIAFHELHEIVLPTKPELVHEMLQRAERAHPDAAGFMFDTLWHWDEIGKVADNRDNEMLYMQNFAKYAQSQSEEKDYRSIMSTDRTITMNFNEILDVPRKSFKSISLPFSTFGAVHSYRGKCGESRFNSDDCKQMMGKVVLDDTISRYASTVRLNFNEVLDHMQMT